MGVGSHPVGSGRDLEAPSREEAGELNTMVVK